LFPLSVNLPESFGGFEQGHKMATSSLLKSVFQEIVFLKLDYNDFDFGGNKVYHEEWNMKKNRFWRA
jgi:hypothetical protein